VKLSIVSPALREVEGRTGPATLNSSFALKRLVLSSVRNQSGPTKETADSERYRLAFEIDDV
jgi:hypothetical protein